MSTTRVIGLNLRRSNTKKKHTSIGMSPMSRPTNKSKRRMYKKYRGQGK
jgi:hypothetical protein